MRNLQAKPVVLDAGIGNSHEPDLLVTDANVRDVEAELF